MADTDFSNLCIEETLQKLGEIMVSTSGTSMYPMLRHRKDMVVIKQAEHPLKKHDVAVYRMPRGKLLIHRVLKVREDCYIIRGDNRINKEYITPDMVFGVLKEFYRGGKKYDCETHKGYKTYIVFMRLTFPFRFLYFYLRKFYVAVKNLILGKKAES